ncbi:HAD-IIIC family phosphatase [Bacillus sp. ISL-51]|uniref:HAD-IIIC family phosphatase n=1 Tax=Bacteria TaxID=2 RepID=UPI001BEC0B15|nr:MULTISPECIES: HAD-IIIC family phosphatase [Bacteria]MBT2574029.1 HAD-IIIC family phosphatase [Bacillus sp. ISL-51]MBT2634640.1 HAD-IIIC family phosphatase [Bacillus sp. ISL-26]MBT2712116.1 HAD-IIIC family phosphatase [Pseudomonas sp. ISL-88]
MIEQEQISIVEKKKQEKIKLVIWDLDQTIWNGVLLEDEGVSLKEGIMDIIHTLDERGILQSISSKNEHSMAMAKLKELEISEYFLYPKINWNSKSSSIQEIVAAINIGMNTVAFVDDQPFELEEVKFELPEVYCINAMEYKEIPNMDIMEPRFITEDSRLRRLMYKSDEIRNKAEKQFTGPKDEFLASLNMVFTISPLQGDDLKRAEELTVRTHQLNTTGYTYSYEELEYFSKSDKHKLFIASLDDKYGSYGKVGLALLECEDEYWTFKLLLMSCRVMSRGVGTVLMNYIMAEAKKAGVKIRAEFKLTDRNRMMYVTYKFGGFKEVYQEEDFVIFENDLSYVQDVPDYMTVKGLD